jgi:hypothetical protein
MDLKPVPAKVSAERHKGAFAEGAALSTGPELKPLDPSPVKTIRLDTTHKVIEIAPGVKYSAWTFGDQVPGPTVRARGGDRLRFSMTSAARFAHAVRGDRAPGRSQGDRGGTPALAARYLALELAAQDSCQAGELVAERINDIVE